MEKNVKNDLEIEYYYRTSKFGNLIQFAKFAGIEFYQQQNYFFNNYEGQLHKYVYEYYNGTIPTNEKYEVHHIDWNTNNNDITNLQLLTKAEHVKLHKTGAIVKQTTIQKHKETKQLRRILREALREALNEALNKIGV